MYQLLLTRKYLFSKIMPLLAAIAVLLCTGTVMLVWSVMGGFLEMLLKDGRAIQGDIKISWPIAGFAHYEDLIAELEKRPEIEAAAPVVETLGVLRLPDSRIKTVSVVGIDGPSYAKVTSYADCLWWRPITPEQRNPKDYEGDDHRLEPLSRLMRLVDGSGMSEAEVRAALLKTWEAMLDDGMTLSERDAVTGNLIPAMVVGIEVTGFNVRKPGGWYQPGLVDQRLPDGTKRQVAEFLPSRKLVLSLIPTDESGNILEVETREVPVANEFRSGAYMIDSGTVFLDLAHVQTLLRMNEATSYEVNLAEPWAPRKVRGVIPARVTSVIVRAAKGATLDMPSEKNGKRGGTAVAACRDAYEAFAERHQGQVPVPSSIQIHTWEEQNAVFVSQVQKETIMVMLVFGIISISSVFLVLSIFWAMISEKTRDIGVIRSLGAGGMSIAGLWMTYGLLLGVLGSGLGTAAAMLMVHNINPIHDWLGNAMGVQVWDPAVYYFTRIPNTIDPMKASVIFVSGVLVSVLGSAWPAVRAALMDPVRALRYE